MSHHDLRTFMSALERNGQLQRLAAPVDPELETTSLSLRALREGGPALLMEHPIGSPHAYLGRASCWPPSKNPNGRPACAKPWAPGRNWRNWHTWPRKKCARPHFNTKL